MAPNEPNGSFKPNEKPKPSKLILETINEKGKECLFHKKLKFGFSFHLTLAQICHQSTLQMLELCIDSKYLFPTSSGFH